MSIPSTIFVGNIGDTVWVKVTGRGTFQNSPGVKAFAQKMIQRGRREFIVDLGGCELMDSTFMGTLAGVALRLRDNGPGTLKTVNVNVRNLALLESLGLDHLFSVETGPASDIPPNLHQAQSGDMPDTKSTALAAHEALVAADAQNAIKFQDVIEYLRQDLVQENLAGD